ncbi:MAG: hypothetical protein GWN18_14320, partial [Thermoplasmata archaeon]|nr:hypothetical protein [Thermoplasmata archaeon]NIS13231.1 hypothetical protein [Thermoplasmata archaeon]NIS21123.1 hypothetical protein [Thermoplasmata archaeon]NIT78606.1 hypothetical protein [Thermoplasmata archaeon]NIU50179.1 hypothetical protein [Thermoplasmata archaeon]
VTFEWSLEVINVNDPPTLNLPKTWTIVEGEEETISLAGTYYDVDNALEELKVMVDNPYITSWDEDAK